MESNMQPGKYFGVIKITMCHYNLTTEIFPIAHLDVISVSFKLSMCLSTSHTYA